MHQIQQNDLRSNCPINYFVEIMGDKWSLIILRDIVFWGKVRHGEFRASSEKIATNILANRLTLLEKYGILQKTVDTSDRRKENYTLTTKGLELIPVLLDITLWSYTFGPVYLSKSLRLMDDLKKDREKTVARITREIHEGGFIFANQIWMPNGETGR